MDLFSIRDLTHYTTWEDLLFIWKHNYSLPDGRNLVVVCNSTGSIGSVMLNVVKRGGVDVA